MTNRTTQPACSIKFQTLNGAPLDSLTNQRKIEFCITLKMITLEEVVGNSNEGDL